jgi:acyl-CoA synthetase (AMP-forming)/AMP-acid ligase II
MDGRCYSWFRTGDQGILDQDGFVFLTGRLKELINRGGEKISPLELDTIMLEHPLVAEAIAFGVDDNMYGQEVHAAIVPKNIVIGDDAIKLQNDVKAFVGKKVASFKVSQYHSTAFLLLIVPCSSLVVELCCLLSKGTQSNLYRYGIFCPFDLSTLLPFIPLPYHTLIN